MESRPLCASNTHEMACDKLEDFRDGPMQSIIQVAEQKQTKKVHFCCYPIRAIPHIPYVCHYYWAPMCVWVSAWTIFPSTYIATERRHNCSLVNYRVFQLSNHIEQKTLLDLDAKKNRKIYTFCICSVSLDNKTSMQCANEKAINEVITCVSVSELNPFSDHTAYTAHTSIFYSHKLSDSTSCHCNQK